MNAGLSILKSRLFSRSLPCCNASFLCTWYYGHKSFVYLFTIFAFLCNCVSSKSMLWKIASFLVQLEAHLNIQPQLINACLGTCINLGLLVRQLSIHPLVCLMKICLSCISARETYKNINFRVLWLILSCVCAPVHSETHGYGCYSLLHLLGDNSHVCDRLIEPVVYLISG